MKKTILLALAIVAMSACTKEESTISAFTDAPVSISTSVAETRATTYTTYTGSDLSLTIIHPSSSDYSYYGTVWEYKNDVWGCDDQVLWRNSTDAVKIYAFASLIGNVATEYTYNNYSGIVDINQSSLASFTSSDFVTYINESYTPTSTKLAIPFEHKLSKFNIALSYGDQFGETTPTVTSVKVNAVNKFTYTIISGVETVAATSDAATAITAYANTANTSYSVILPAQSITTGNLIDIVIDGDTFSLPAGSGYSFVSNYEYNIKVRVGKDVTVVEDITVGGWSTGSDFSDGDAEYQSN
ncbi:MAG: fimbrillin family protein [Rikenellaceae bacterium]